MTNPAVRALGYPEEARLLVTHLDDVGMNPGANTAWESTLRAGALASASVMMPCPAAHDALSLAGRLAAEKTHPDLGVHLTLTCEWDVHRWGSYNPALNQLLSDSEGFLPRTEGVHESATATPAGRKAVEDELHAQIDGALARYTDITHLDSHMFALLYPPNLEIYIRLALEYRLPCMLGGSVEAWRDWCGTEEQARGMAQAVSPLRDAGMPLFDRIAGMPLENPPRDRPAAARNLIQNSVPGLNFLFLHANDDTREIREIAGDWEARKGDMDVFSDPELKNFIEGEGIHLVGMRELRNLWRSAGTV